MRTTVRLDDALYRRVKREAARRKQTVTSMIESSGWCSRNLKPLPGLRPSLWPYAAPEAAFCPG